MYNNYKVKVLIFAGRKDTMSILMPQIKSDYIDEIIIGVNTNNQEDLKFIYSLKDNEPKITYLEVPNNIRRCSQESFRFFYTKMEDEDTIYFKLDDDLIYIEPGYFEKTLKFRCENPEYICVYPMIINNPLCNYLLRNDIPMKYKKDNPGEFMFATWKDPDVAEHLLSLFARFKNEKDLWHIKNFEFGKEQNYHLSGGRIIRPSINAICFFGKDFKELNVKNYQIDDEEFLTNQVFNCNRKSIIYGDTLVTHYAFFTQRNYLNSKNILNLYKNEKKINLIGNNCGSAFYYKKKNLEFTNPFTWAAVTPKDMIYLIKNYDNINFNNFKIIDLDKELFKTNNLITQKINEGGDIKGITIDDKVSLYYTHYLSNKIKFNNREDIDVYCEDNEKYVSDKYIKRLKRMTEKPLFLIITYPHHNWTKSDVEELSKLETDKSIILITNYNMKFKENVHLIYDNLADLNSSNMIDKHISEINSIIENYYM